MGKIIEKSRENQPLPQLNFTASVGFPRPKRRDANSETSSESGSIFARQFKRMKKAKEPPKPVTEVSLPSQSFVVSGSERDSIHAENIAKMKEMSEDEILEERQRLIATMDPAIIAFLKSRRQKEDTKMNRTPTIQEQNEAAENMEIDEIETASEILKQPKAEKWLNFKTVETGKLAWMKSIEMPKIDKKQSFEAR